ncbi:TPA: hypothetical protein ACX6PX_001481 [Photobacterium damselae]
MEANALTVLAILVAGYTLLAEEKRIDLKLRFSWIDKCVIFLLVSTLLYTIYLPILDAINLSLPLPWLWGFDEKLTAFTAIVVILLYLTVKLVGKRLPKSKTSAWQKASSHLLRNQKFEALTFLLDKYHPQFIATFQDHWYDRVRAKLLAPYRPSIRELIAQSMGKQEKKTFGSRTKSRLVSILKPLVLLISKCLPDDSKYKQEVSASISDLLKSNLFVKHLTQTQPLLCAQFTTTRFNSDEEFTTAFLKELIANTSSPLYRELRDNQSCSYTGEYYIDESNPLLYFYFNDIEVASQVGVWKPIGDYTLEFIGKQKGQDNYYNQPFSYTYFEEDKWKCPIFMSIHFFNVMTSRAIHTGHQDHMWLMYLENFVGAMIENYDPNSEVDTEREFPTRFDYLMYEALDVFTEWVGAAVHNSDKNNKVTISEKSIPVYYAATTLGNTFYTLIKSRKITGRQYVYYLENVIRLLKKLDDSGNQALSKIIVENIIKKYEYSRSDRNVINALISYYSEVDHILKNKDSTFEHELSSILGSPIRPAPHTSHTILP